MLSFLKINGQKNFKSSMFEKYVNINRIATTPLSALLTTKTTADFQILI